jgi:aryl-alcohol dehydrogenase-like predicted oxidoreductase
MRTVELTKGIHSSVLGFGCAPILGSIDAKTAKYALDFAIGHGINHLDLARSYGYGEAEGFVGKLVNGKRHEMVLASKFGIKPSWKATLLKSVKPLIRTLRNQIKGSEVKTASPAATSVTNIAGSFLERIVPLRGEDMRKSLEKSLRELRSDYLDYFFIHEPLHTLTYFDELQETAEILKTEGKIRAWGIAYMQSQQHLHEAYINNLDLLQFNKPPGLPDYNKLISTRGWHQI